MHLHRSVVNEDKNLSSSENLQPTFETMILYGLNIYDTEVMKQTHAQAPKNICTLTVCFEVAGGSHGASLLSVSVTL